MSHTHVTPVIIMLGVLVVALPLTGLLLRRRLLAAAPTPRTKLWRYARTIVILWSLTALAWYALRLHGLQASDIGVRPPHAFGEYFIGFIFVALMLLLSSARRTLDRDYRRGIDAVVPASADEWLLFIPLDRKR